MSLITNPITCAGAGLVSSQLLSIPPVPDLTPTGNIGFDILKAFVVLVGIIPSVLHLLGLRKKKAGGEGEGEGEKKQDFQTSKKNQDGEEKN